MMNAGTGIRSLHSYITSRNSFVELRKLQASQKCFSTKQDVWPEINNSRFSEKSGRMHQGDMSITLLGTGSQYPSPYRAASGLIFKYRHQKGGSWLFDCGEGSALQILRTHLTSDFSRIFISHLDGDHYFGLPGILLSKNSAEKNQKLMCRMSGVRYERKILEIIGPPGLRRYVEGVLELQRSQFLYGVIVHELHRIEKTIVSSSRVRGLNVAPDSDGIWRSASFESEPGPISVELCALPHTRNTPSFGCVLTEASVPGNLSMDLLKKKISNHPGYEGVWVDNEVIREQTIAHKFIKKLKDGLTVDIDFGHGPVNITPDEVISRKNLGRKITILSDTCDATPIAKLAANSTLVVHETTSGFLDHRMDSIYNDIQNGTYKAFQRKVFRRGHSTPQNAALFAKAVNAKVLVLNHFSQSYARTDGRNENTKFGDFREACIFQYPVALLMAYQCKELFSGDVIAGRDLMTIQVSLDNKPPNLGLLNQNMLRNDWISKHIFAPSRSFTILDDKIRETISEVYKAVRAQASTVNPSYVDIIKYILQNSVPNGPRILNMIGFGEIYLFDTSPFNGFKLEPTDAIPIDVSRTMRKVPKLAVAKPGELITSEEAEKNGRIVSTFFRNL